MPCQGPPGERKQIRVPATLRPSQTAVSRLQPRCWPSWFEPPSSPEPSPGSRTEPTFSAFPDHPQRHASAASASLSICGGASRSVVNDPGQFAAARDEDELQAWSVGGIADLVDLEPGSAKRLLDGSLGSEPKSRVGGQHSAVGQVSVAAQVTNAANEPPSWPRCWPRIKPTWLTPGTSAGSGPCWPTPSAGAPTTPLSRPPRGCRSRPPRRPRVTSRSGTTLGSPLRGPATRR